MSDNITNTNTNINTTGDHEEEDNWTMKKCHKCGEEFEAEEERASINCDDCGFDCGDEKCKDCREYHNPPITEDEEEEECDYCGFTHNKGFKCPVKEFCVKHEK